MTGRRSIRHHGLGRTDKTGRNYWRWFMLWQYQGRMWCYGVRVHAPVEQPARG